MVCAAILRGMKRESEPLNWWTSAGNFLLGFCVAAEAARRAISDFIRPAAEADHLGVMLMFWGPLLVLLVFLCGIAGGMSAVLLARVVHRTQGRPLLVLAAAAGCAIFAWGAAGFISMLRR